MTLCPRCARPVEDFLKGKAADGSPMYRCRLCGENVPVEYVRDAGRYPITAVSLIGFTQQGKTVYLSGLLGELEQRRRRWGKYYSTPINEDGWKALREKRELLDKGELPPPTQHNVFNQPVVLQLEDVPRPRLNRCRLLLYDTTGNAFVDTAALAQYGAYALHSPVVVLLIDLLDTSQLKNLQMLLLNYLNALRRQNIDPKERTLLVVLTKGDMLKGLPDLPDEVGRFLDGEEDPEEADDLWFELERLSDRIEGWLDREHGHFVRQARKELRAVKYCVVSALGAEPRTLRLPGRPDKRLLSITPVPRGVMVPLFWLWGVQWLAPVWLNGTAYYSLRWAAQCARDKSGATLRLDRGRQILSTTLVIDYPLRLVGVAGRDAAANGRRSLPSRIVSEAPGAAVRVVGRGRLVAEDVSFEQHPRPRGRGPTHVVVAEGGEVEFRRCRFKGADWDAGRKYPGSGLKLAGPVTGRVIDCESSGHGGFGIHVCGTAAPLLEGNTCCGNAYAGIGYSDSGSGTARNNTCTENTVAGIVLWQNAAPVLGPNNLKPNGREKVYDARRRRPWWRALFRRGTGPATPPAPGAPKGGQQP